LGDKGKLWISAFIALALLSTRASANCAILNGPYLVKVTPYSITVMWESDEKEKGMVQYGVKGFEMTKEEDRPSLLHEIEIRGLRPGERYRYKVISGRDTAEGSFKTAPLQNPGHFKFVVYGDSRGYPKRHGAIASLIAKEEPDFVIHTGDLVSDGSKYDRWGKEFFEPAAEMLRNAPFYPCRGNHETKTGRLFSIFFLLPEDKPWYCFTYGNATFIFLDYWGWDTPEQERWLERKLKEAHTKWKFVVMHSPLFSSGGHKADLKLRNRLHPMFSKYEVQMVFAGHNHFYQRTAAIDGVIYITTGGGGAPLYTPKREEFVQVSSRSYHYCVVEVKEDLLTLTAKDIRGEVIDRFIIHAPPRSSSPSPEPSP
jgi:predicted phosphodiesterase